RHRLRRDERRHLDVRHTRVQQRLDQGDSSRHVDRRLGLQSVARAHLAHVDARGDAAHVGGTPWRRSLNERSLLRAIANRATSASRSASGSTTASTTSSEARRSRSTSASYSRRRSLTNCARSVGSSMAPILLAYTALTAASGPITAIWAEGRAIV